MTEKQSERQLPTVPETVPASYSAPPPPAQVPLVSTAQLRQQFVYLKEQLQLLTELMKDVLVENVDYGKIPGVDKPSLWKPGAEKICTLFRLDPQFTIEERILEDDFIMYSTKCTIYHIPSGARWGSYIGSCNSHEEKYRWTKALLSEYEVSPDEQRRLKVRGYGDNAYTVYQVHGDPYEILNTIQKQSCKRAMVGAVLVTTNASAIFTQDLSEEDDSPSGKAKPRQDGKAPPISQGQRNFLFKLLSGAGVPDDKEQQLKTVREAYEKKTGSKLREIASVNDLLLPEATIIINVLKDQNKE
jgi:hypothetical protein